MDQWVIGSDESGMGNMAGDLVVVAVALPSNFKNEAVADSKKLSAKKRREVFENYKGTVMWEVFRATPQQIDNKGITRLCLEGHLLVQAKLHARLSSLGEFEIFQVVDGFATQQKKFGGIHCETKADSKFAAVSMASCFATSLVDQAMESYARDFPDYNFASHKGYGVKHMAEIEKFGVLDIHRRSFGPVRKAMK